MKYLYCLFVVFVFTGCNSQEKPSNNKEMKLNIEELKKTMQFQKNIETDEVEPENPYELTRKDFQLSNAVIYEYLINNGYKKPSPKYFEDKVNLFFKEIITNKCQNFTEDSELITFFGNKMDGNKQTLLENQFELQFYTENIFIDKKIKIISNMFLLEELLEILPNNTYKIKLPYNIIARNKYLFNDSKADLIWLLINDKEFLKQLLLVFGYDRELQINKMVLEEYFEKYAQAIPTQTERIGDLFFVKDCRGKLQIREGLLKYVEENTNANDNRFIYALGSYMNYLYDKDVDKIFEEDHSKKFSEVEKAKIVAFIASIENLAIEKYKGDNPEVWSNAASNLYNLSVSHPEVIDIIKKNNYFNLPNMKDIIDKLAEEAQLVIVANED